PPRVSITVPSARSMPYWRATASVRSAVGSAWARTTVSPTCMLASRDAWACPWPPAGPGAPLPQPASARPSTMAAAMRGARSVIGSGQLAAAFGGVADRPVDQFAQAAVLAGFDRGVGGAAGRGDAAAPLG